MTNYLKNLSWIIKHPAYFPEFSRKIRYRLNLRRELLEAKVASDKLSTLSVSEHEALKILFGTSAEIMSYEERHKVAISEANQRVTATNDTLGGPAALDFLYNAVRLSGAKAIVETGVAYGWSSLAILLALDENGSGKLESIDFPQLGTSGESVGVAVPHSLRRLWTLHIGPDRLKLPIALVSLTWIDMCHYDSDKSAAGRRFAYPLLWSSLKNGGIFISDDIGDNMAFLEFATSVRSESTAVVIRSEQGGGKFIGALKKCPCPGSSANP